MVCVLILKPDDVLNLFGYKIGTKIAKVHDARAKQLPYWALAHPFLYYFVDNLGIFMLHNVDQEERNIGA